MITLPLVQMPGPRIANGLLGIVDHVRVAINVFLRTGQKETVDQAVFDCFAVARLVPALDDDSSSCLRFVDPYGDTIFDHLRVPVLARELRRVRDGATESQVRSMLDDLISLAERCGTSEYLWFIGD